MYGQTSHHSLQKSSAPGLAGLLIGLVSCYQIASYIFQWKALSHEEGEFHGNDLEGTCDSHCMEAHLFSAWSESPQELESLLAIHPQDSPQQQTPVTSTVLPASGNLRASSAVASESANDALSQESDMEIGTAAMKRYEQRMRGSAKKREHDSKPAVNFAKSIEDLQAKLEAKMQSQARRHAEHRALRALAHASHGSAEILENTAADPEDGLTAWAHNLEDATHDLQDHMKARTKARAEHAAVHAAHLAELRAGLREPAPQEAHALLDDIQSLGQQLCQSPERRNTPACAHFVHSNPLPSNGHHTHKSAEERHADAQAHIQLLEKHMEELHKEQQHDSDELKAESMEFMKVLCSDPARSSYPACARMVPTPKGSFLAKAEPAATAVKALRQESNFDASSMKMMLHRQELRAYHWDGKIPKVACVTVLPQGHGTEVLMRYFMDNYNLQHYEGERQLIIVYHNADPVASRVAHLYADGTSVIAAAARGNDEFPSATAYRYGAWLAKDADIIARWDFDAWHHPNRLSMQVRALNLVQRPVSMVARITGFDAQENQFVMAGGSGPRGSMIGKAAWMKKHWMPLLEEERSVPLGLHGHHVVQIDMPELLAYHDVSNSDEAAALIERDLKLALGTR